MKTKSINFGFFIFSPYKKNKIEEQRRVGGITYKEVGDYIVICKKYPTLKTLHDKFQYQKDFFCYADLLYKTMTKRQKEIWHQYYNDHKDKITIEQPRKGKKKKTRFRRKHWGYHNFALWVWSVFHDALGEFFYDYLKSRYVINSIEAHMQKIKVDLTIMSEEIIKEIERLKEEYDILMR